MRMWMRFSALILATAASTACATHSVQPTAHLAVPPAAPATMPAVADVSEPAISLPQAAIDAVGADKAKAAAAIAQLRAAGYAGIDALVNAYPTLLNQKLRRPTGFPVTPAPEAATREQPTWERFSAALDSVAMQKDAYGSRLFWFTDLEAAKAEAQRQNKPILSLRMLGNLNEDLSCANSRFFRTTLYPNAQVSAYLREHFILHWQSVRPVPVVTIDMGDGRSMVRTITGNSIHYVLDSQGRVIDGIPGLYGAKDFLAALDAAYTPAVQSGQLDNDAHHNTLVAFAMSQRRRIQLEWAADLARVDADAIPAETDPAAISDELWKHIAALHADAAGIDQTAAAVVNAKIPMEVAMRLTISKSITESPLAKLIRNLQDSIALDTVKNEYTMHGRIMTMIATGEPLATLNDRVYAEVFLTPNSDPWLGLASPDIFAAIDNGGIHPAKTTASR